MLGHQKVWYHITTGNFKFHSISLNEYLNRFSKACPKPNELKLQFSRGCGHQASTDHIPCVISNAKCLASVSISETLRIHLLVFTFLNKRNTFAFRHSFFHCCYQNVARERQKLLSFVVYNIASLSIWAAVINDIDIINFDYDTAFQPALPSSLPPKVPVVFIYCNIRPQPLVLYTVLHGASLVSAWILLSTSITLDLSHNYSVALQVT